MDPGDDRGSRHQQGLTDVLVARGITDAGVLAAFAAVPRHRFVERFWVLKPDGQPGDPGAIRAVDLARDDDALDLVYDPDRALVTAGSVEGYTATSSLSAPWLVAGMLLEQELAPGLRVLEIGAGSGWHAALLAAVVGDPALVTSVEIDAELAATARRNLDALGLGALAVITGDGFAGYPAHAPYDRIVATVGCADLAPAWVDQLDPAGTLLVPLVHGAWHPRVLVAPTGEAGTVAGRFVGHSGFVSIQGAQADASPWGRPPPPAPPGPTTRTQPLPAAVAEALRGDDRTAMHRSGGLAFYLSLRDAGAGRGGLWRPDGSAVVLGDRLVIDGDGDGQAERLLSLATDWVDLGAPGITRYTTEFTRRVPSDPGATAPGLTGPVGPGATDETGPWLIDRLHHRQMVTLTDPA